MASINDLDNPLLLLILNRLSVQKLFTAGHVCVRWNAMKTISAGDRKELVVMVGNEAQNILDRSESQSPLRAVLADENGERLYLEFDQNVQLKVKSFPMDCARLLGDHFLKLTTLTLSVEFDAYQDSVRYLLCQFSIFPRSQLRELKLFIGWNLKRIKPDSHTTRNFPRIIQAVNSIETLRKLTLEIEVGTQFSYHLHLPILAHLEEFELHAMDMVFTGLSDSILSYAVNNQKLRKISINSESCSSPTDNVAWYLKLPPEFASRFTYLHCKFTCRRTSNAPQFDQICERFNRLTSLRLTGVCNSNFHQLPLLDNLLYLEFDYDDALKLISPLMKSGQFPRVASVKMLTFTYYYDKYPKTDHRFLRNFRLDPLFPNVQVVHVNLEHPRCYECHRMRKSKTHCIRHIFRHFTQYPQLRMVSLNIGERNEQIRQWPIDELNDLSDSDSEMGSDTEAEPNPNLYADSEPEEEEMDIYYYNYHYNY